MSESKIKDFLHKKGEAYTAGFLRKCAEEGVDPELLKQSLDNSDLGNIGTDVLVANKFGRFVEDLKRALYYARTNKLERGASWATSPYKTYRGRSTLLGAEQEGGLGAGLGALAGGAAGAIHGDNPKQKIIQSVLGALTGGAAGGAGGGLLGAYEGKS